MSRPTCAGKDTPVRASSEILMVENVNTHELPSEWISPTPPAATAILAHSSRQPDPTRTPQDQPHPPTRSTRLHHHPHPRSLTTSLVDSSFSEVLREGHRIAMAHGRCAVARRAHTARGTRHGEREHGTTGNRGAVREHRNRRANGPTSPLSRASTLPRRSIRRRAQGRR